jgi:hypothetical protein
MNTLNGFCSNGDETSSLQARSVSMQAAAATTRGDSSNDADEGTTLEQPHLNINVYTIHSLCMPEAKDFSVCYGRIHRASPAPPGAVAV